MHEQMTPRHRPITALIVIYEPIYYVSDALKTFLADAP